MSKKPQGRGEQFAREARIGLSILASLVMVFIILAYKRYHHQFDPPSANVRIHNMADKKPDHSAATKRNQVKTPVLTRGHANATNKSTLPQAAPKSGPVFLRGSDSAQESPSVRQQNRSQGFRSQNYAASQGSFRPLPDQRSPSLAPLDSNRKQRVTNPGKSLTQRNPAITANQMARQVAPPVVSGQTYALRNQQRSTYAGANSVGANPVGANSVGSQSQRVVSRPQKRYETIDADESFFTLSQRVYGSGQYFRALHAYVRQSQPNLESLPANRRIEIPTLDALRRNHRDLFPEEANQASAGYGQQLYRIEAGWAVIDHPINLFDLARDIYGQASRFSDLVEANRDRLPASIGAMDMLPAGTRLRLPR